MKLALGTAQLGLDYGISNRAGRVSAIEARRILDLAARRGVRMLDTAAAYGDAERTLGALLPAAHPFALVTKLRAGDRLADSLDRLGAQRVYGVLAHHARDLLGAGGPALWASLETARAAGQAEKIGASVYTAAEVDALLARFPLQLIQLPLNLLDQRLLHGGHLARLRGAGVEIHARSVFLQGLLLMDPADLPPALAEARAPLRAVRDAATRAGCTPLQLAAGFVLGLPEVDRVVCGVTAAAELEEIIAAAATAVPRALGAPLAIDDERILNPAQWPRP